MAVGGGNGPGIGTQAILRNHVLLTYKADIRLKDYPTPSPDTTTFFFTASFVPSTRSVLSKEVSLFVIAVDVK